MKYILVLILMSLRTLSWAQQAYDITITGSFSLSDIIVGTNSTLTLNLCNVTTSSATIPAGGLSVNINFGSGFEGNLTPTGTIASAFNWLDIGTGWYGITNTSLPFPSCGTIMFEVSGLMTGETPSDWFAQLQAPNHDATPSNNTGGAVLAISSPLSIDISSFNVTDGACGEAVILWTTASESNNDVMILERSEDGMAYIPIHHIHSNDAIENTTYTFLDKHLNKNKPYFYRLKQIDVAGREIYFGPFMISPKPCDLNEKSFSMYPNPCVDQIYITLNGFDDEAGQKMIITNSDGMQVLSIENVQHQQTNEVKVKHLPVGVYSVQFLGQEAIKAKQFIKIE